MVGKIFRVVFTRMDYKIIFTIQKKAAEVIILTIRNDAEDPDKIMEEL